MSRQVRGIAIVVALVAIAYVVISHRNHHDGLDTGGVPVDVLVASKRIQRGTPGNVIRTTGLYEIRNIPQSNIEPGAIVDPAAFAGRVALTDIAAGQQLTTADFGRCACLFTPGPSRRAVIVSPREIRGHVTAGSHVDVWDGGRHRLYSDMDVLAVGAADGTVTLGATPRQAGRLIYLIRTSKARLILRVRSSGAGS